MFAPRVAKPREAPRAGGNSDVNAIPDRDSAMASTATNQAMAAECKREASCSIDCIACNDGLRDNPISDLGIATLTRAALATDHSRLRVVRCDRRQTSLTHNRSCTGSPPRKFASRVAEPRAKVRVAKGYRREHGSRPRQGNNPRCNQSDQGRRTTSGWNANGKNLVR